ncbi:hypothetical protein PIB30_072460 [Stylosanthes scabra]|uniref:Aminotransferase-like plant mobile domain-containing protein n=1 Tax=Stylosanthes scabra TaxID=79078 RepID=A0ABU6XMB9_9FABA|nr:hypothetical protein [Stylosanthes scabra]
MREFQLHYQQDSWEMVDQFLGVRPPVPANGPSAKEAFAIRMVWLRERLLAHSRGCRRADTSPVRQMIHPLVHRRIPDALQVGQPGTFAVASSADGLWCMCAVVLGQCCPSLDVPVVVQCSREADHRYSRMCPPYSVMDIPPIFWDFLHVLIGYQQPGRDQQEGRLLHWRSRLDRVTLDEFRWTPYMTPGMRALIPDWMRSQGEVYTWRSAVPVVCFNYVHMHHVDRVIRQYGGEQPIPRSPVDMTRFMFATGRGDDVWWLERLQEWYDGWRHQRTPEVMVTVHDGDLRGT